MNEISTALRKLKMPGMADCWERLTETRKTETITTGECLQILIQAERESRLNSRNRRLVRNARFRYHATTEEMAYDAARGLDRLKVMDMTDCDYIRKGVPVLITGAAGTGKSHLATALGMKACEHGLKVAYFNLYKLFEEMTLARVTGTSRKLFTKLSKVDLLILDDFGVKILDGQQLLDFMELIEDRHGISSTIIVSQLPVCNWYDVLKGNTTAADAILDRVVHTAIRFELSGDSLRKRQKTTGK